MAQRKVTQSTANIGEDSAIRAVVRTVNEHSTFLNGLRAGRTAQELDAQKGIDFGGRGSLMQIDFIFAEGTGGFLRFTPRVISTARPIAEWLWLFPDGTTSDVKEPAKLFAAGEHRVRLIARAEDGTEALATRFVQVTGGTVKNKIPYNLRVAQVLNGQVDLSWSYDA